MKELVVFFISILAFGGIISIFLTLKEGLDNITEQLRNLNSHLLDIKYRIHD